MIDINKINKILEFDDEKIVNIYDYLPSQNSVKKEFEISNIFSSNTKTIYDKVNKVLKYSYVPILILGETGTGKEVLAKYIHYNSPNSSGNFVGINCSNLPGELFESELFGYEKGAFTGANLQGMVGKIELASNGTIFLDEISEISMDLQAKLLRVIQERKFFKLGGTKHIDVNCRFLFATNKNIQTLIKNGTFREDLYYRINLCEVELPPLRKRKEEILPYIFYFIDLFNQELNKNVRFVKVSFLKEIYNYHFPGNLRELRNIISKIVLFNENDLIEDFGEFSFQTEILNNNISEDYIGDETKKVNFKFSFDGKNIEIPDQPFDLEELEKKIVKKVLDKFGGNRTKAANFLGLNRIQMYGRFKDVR